MSFGSILCQLMSIDLYFFLSSLVLNCVMGCVTISKISFFFFFLAIVDYCCAVGQPSGYVRSRGQVHHCTWLCLRFPICNMPETRSVQVVCAFLPN